MRQRIDLPCDELGASYLAGATIQVLARHYGCSPATIANRLHGCGIARRDARFRPIALPEAALRGLYLDERRPLAEIAAYFAVSTSTIGNKRRAYGIPIRPRTKKSPISNE